MKTLNNALVAIRRSPYQSILSIVVITITFFVAYCFSLLSIGSARVLSFFETQPQVIAFMQLDAADEAINSLANVMRGKSYVRDVKVVTKQDALTIYQQENQNNPLLLELVTDEILPASVEVSAINAKDLEQIRNDLQSDSNVDEAVLQESVVSNLIRWTGAMRWIGLFILLVLMTTSFLMIMVTISMKVSSKRGQIKIMKFIGASNAYISSPYLMEAAVSSSLANLLAFALYYALVLYMTPWFRDFLAGVISFPIPWQFFAYQLLAGVVLALLLGSLASIVAVQRMLKK